MGGHRFAWLAAEPPRHALLQDLHDGGSSALARLANEQVNVVRHDDVTHEREPVTVAHFAQNPHKQILRARRGKQGQPSVTAARDEVEVSQSVPTSQAFRHGKSNQKPRP